MSWVIRPLSCRDFMPVKKSKTSHIGLVPEGHDVGRNVQMQKNQRAVGTLCNLMD